MLRKLTPFWGLRNHMFQIRPKESHKLYLSCQAFSMMSNLLRGHSKSMIPSPISHFVIFCLGPRPPCQAPNSDKSGLKMS